MRHPRYPWWDWGNRVMRLVGNEQGGAWEHPSKTWWYRLGPAKPMVITSYPTHPLSTFEVITNYQDFKTRTEGLNADQMYEWKAISINQDGELILGHCYWGGSFYGMPKHEVALLRRYLRMWRRHDWYGARSWLYSQALHAAVYQRKPFACQQPPPPTGGGYSHWLCTEKRRHAGPHRYKNYKWDDGGPTCYAPGEVAGKDER